MFHKYTSRSRVRERGIYCLQWKLHKLCYTRARARVDVDNKVKYCFWSPYVRDRLLDKPPSLALSKPDQRQGPTVRPRRFFVSRGWIARSSWEIIRRAHFHFITAIFAPTMHLLSIVDAMKNVHRLVDRLSLMRQVRITRDDMICRFIAYRAILYRYVGPI